MKLLDSWIKKKIDKRFEEKEEKINSLNNKIEDIQQAISTNWKGVCQLRSQISELETAKLKVPIEEYLFNSKKFQTALRLAKERAMATWPPYHNFKPFLSNISGAVEQDRPFECIINERFMVLIAGLKTRYSSEQEDRGLFRMTIGDRRTRPFSVDRETRQVIFLTHYLIEEEYLFSITQIEGAGVLNFSVIGAVISPFGYDRREYEIWPRQRGEVRNSTTVGMTCFICGRTIHNKDAVADAKLLEKYTGQNSGVLCCSCFKVAKTIIEGKAKGGEE